MRTYPRDSMLLLAAAALVPCLALAQVAPRESTGLVPLTEMSASDRYKGEDGGLYGQGRNTPPAAHRKAAEGALSRVRPLDAEGNPSPDGTIVLVSISMSNATQEFSFFKRKADADPGKSPRVTIVDCAQGGQAMAEWVDPQAAPWHEADRRLAAAGVTARQVQAAWIKLANKGPRGDLAEHGKKLQQDSQAVIRNARARFPNLQVVYLGSRIYGGYAVGRLNPEPYAYESGFVVRWLIQDQIRGSEALSPARMPVLVWGPYLWGDGVNPRKLDGERSLRRVQEPCGRTRAVGADIRGEVDQIEAGSLASADYPVHPLFWAAMRANASRRMYAQSSEVISPTGLSTPSRS